MAGESILYRCRRCGSNVTEPPHDDAETALRWAIESAPTIVHECPAAHPQAGGAFGVCDLIGTSERPKPEEKAA